MSSRSLAEVVGANCKRIRTTIGITQDDLARYARDLGLRWNAAKVGDFEAGRSTPAFTTVLTVLLALQTAVLDTAQRRADAAASSGWMDDTGAVVSALPPAPPIEVTLAELVRVPGGFVALNDTVDVPGGDLADVCSGEIPQLGRVRKKGEQATQPYDWDRRMGDISNLLQRSGLTEDRLARRLTIGRARLADESFRLWRSTFSEERDRRAGPGANQQKKGRISRELRAELQKALADGND